MPVPTSYCIMSHDVHNMSCCGQTEELLSGLYQIIRYYINKVDKNTGSFYIKKAEKLFRFKKCPG
jgi:hypothetical protein